MVQLPVSSSNFSLHLALTTHTTQSTQILPILQGLSIIASSEKPLSIPPSYMRPSTSLNLTHFSWLYYDLLSTLLIYLPYHNLLLINTY